MNPLRHDEEGRGISYWVRWLQVLLVVAILGAGAWFFAANSSQLQRLVDAPLSAIGLLSGGAVLSLILSGARLKLLYRRFGIRLPFKEWASLSAMTSVTNYLPMQPGVVVRAVYMRRRHELPYSSYLATVVFARCLALLTACTLGLVFVLVDLLSSDRLHLELMLFLAAAVLVVLGVLLVRPKGRSADKSSLGFLRQLAEGWRLLRDSKGLICGIVLLDLLFLGVFVGRLYLSFLAVGYAVSFKACLAIGPLAYVSGFVQLFPAGLGIREATVACLTGMLGFDWKVGVAAATLDRAVSAAWTFLLGAVSYAFLFRVTARRDRVMQESVRDGKGPQATNRPGKPRIGIWYRGGISPNQGDRAILTAMVQMIREKLPRAELYVLARDCPQVERWLKVKTIPLGIASFPSFLRRLRGLELLLWGGGNVLQESTFFWLPYQAFFVLVARRMKVRVMCFATGAGPFRTYVIKKLLKRATQWVELITVRDEHSLQLLTSLGVPRKKLVLTADPAVVLQSVSDEEARTLLEREGVSLARPLLGFGMRAWYESGFGILPVQLALSLGLWPRGGRRLHEELCRKIAAAADHAVRERGLQVLFVPMYNWGRLGDDVVAEQILSFMRFPKEAHVLRQFYTSEQLLGIVKQCALFVGARMHSTVMALTSGVPTICLYYAPKGRELFNRVGQAEYAESIERFGLEWLCGRIDKAWKHRDSIRQGIQQNLLPLRAMARKNVDEMIMLLRDR